MNITITSILNYVEHQAYCTLFSMDGINLLFDCGWSKDLHNRTLLLLKDKLSMKIDYIFLSNNCIDYIGALPYIMTFDNVKEAKIYSTTPITKLGFYMIIDSLISKIEKEQFDLFNETDISNSYINLNEIKYNQNIEIQIKSNKILLTPITSGFSFGGAVWKMIYKLRTFLYAPEFNIESKLSCNPLPFEKFEPPYALITDSRYTNLKSVTKAITEEAFRAKVLSSINEKRNIFIPTDTANNCLELLLFLEKIFSEIYANKTKEELQQLEKNEIYTLYLCGYSSFETLESMKSFVEWMGTEITKVFSSYNDINTFTLKYVKCIKDVNEYFELRKANNKHIILSSFESLDHGISYKLVPYVITDKLYDVYIVDRSYEGSFIRNISKNLHSKQISYNEIIRTNNEKVEEEKIENINEEVEKIQKPDVKYDFEKTKKKLFSKNLFPMFSYLEKRKFTEHGIVIYFV